VDGGRLAGIVTRANLLQAVASAKPEVETPMADAGIRDALLAHLQNQAWARPWLLNVIVRDGVIDLWGVARSEPERKAVRIAAEAIPGVRAVNDNLVIRPW
jgi:osmotically-inducible protein OsmY